MSELFKLRPDRKPQNTLLSALESATTPVSNTVIKFEDPKKPANQNSLLNYMAIKRGDALLLDKTKPLIQPLTFSNPQNSSGVQQKLTNFVFRPSKDSKNLESTVTGPIKFDDMDVDNKEQVLEKERNIAEKSLLLQKHVLEKRAKLEAPEPPKEDHLEKRVKQEMFEKARLQLLNEEDMRREMLMADKRVNLLSNIDSSNQMGVNLLDDSVDENIEDTTAKLDQFLNYLLHHPFELKIKDEDVKTKRLPTNYANYSSYHQKNVYVMLDEIRSQFISKKNSEEFVGQKLYDLEFTFLPNESTRTYLYMISLPKDAEDVQSYQDLFAELDKGIAMIQVTVRNRRQKIDEEFIGIKVKNKGKLKNTENFVFKFSTHFTDHIVNKFDKFVLKAKYFDDFTSSQRELKALLKICSASFNIFHKVLNAQVASELRVEILSSNNPLTLSNKLNASQREAITNLCDPNRRVGLLQGPPGTGKSFTLIEMVRHILLTDKSDKKIFICTPSNCALDELLLRFTKTFNLFNHIDNDDQNNKKPDVLRIIRVGKCSDNVPDAVLRQTLDNIIKIKYKIGNDRSITKELKEDQELLKDLMKKNEEAMGKDKIISARIDEMRRIIDEKRNLRSYNTTEIKKNIIKDVKIVFSTLNSSAKKILKVLKDHISYLIVDEATQSTEIQSMVPLILSPDRLILIGDPCQLPATTFHPLSKQLNLQRSFFERLQELKFRVFMLKTQYRMVPSICKFSSDRFYNSELESDSTVRDPSYINSKARGFLSENFRGKSVVFIQVRGETKKRNNSYYNVEEKDVIKRYVKKLKDANMSDFGIITPYKQQVRYLKQSFHFKYDNDDIMVNTVDGFQGKEKDIIFVSCVKSMMNSSQRLSAIGFLDDPRRLNVAITRAKYALIIVGDFKTLRQSEMWAQFIDYIKSVDGMINVHQSPHKMRDQRVEGNAPGRNKEHSNQSKKSMVKEDTQLTIERCSKCHSKNCVCKKGHEEVRHEHNEVHSKAAFKSLFKKPEKEPSKVENSYKIKKKDGYSIFDSL